MTFLLNMAAVIIVALGALLYWKFRKVWIIVVTLIALAVYGQIQPSYIPKSTIERSMIPAFEPSDAEIQDRNSKPMSGEERDRRMEEKVRTGIDYGESKIK